jgi:hypothetical protein
MEMEDIYYKKLSLIIGMDGSKKVVTCLASIGAPLANLDGLFLDSKNIVDTTTSPLCFTVFLIRYLCNLQFS